MKTYSRGERGDEPLERKDDTVLGQRNWVGEAEGVGGGAGMIRGVPDTKRPGHGQWHAMGRLTRVSSPN